MRIRIFCLLIVLIFTRNVYAQLSPFPQNYFRNPLNIPLQLVANFGEIRTNHWHMGLDIRTQQKVNLPVYASADGYIARVSVEPGGFGQAIYINHPNGYTTLYAHLNSFFPALERYVRQQQYAKESWKINLVLPSHLFPVKKSDFIALSGSTGGSEGPHVHFEIRDTKTENCLNPILFKFPIADAVPPTIARLAMYDRNKSTYMQQPQFLALKKSGTVYTISNNSVRVGTDKISFAIGATDRFSATPNPNGIYSAAIFLDGRPISSFVHDDISYNDSRYINAQLDYPYKAKGGAALQHISPLPSVLIKPYKVWNTYGIIQLNDTEVHEIIIDVKDANFNLSRIKFNIQFDESLVKKYLPIPGEKFLPNSVNIFESDGFEIFTTEQTMYDTASVSFGVTNAVAMNAASPLFNFFSAAIPVHDSVTVKIKMENIGSEFKHKIIIKNMAGSRTFIKKAVWQKNNFVTAKFRQYGTYQAFVDNDPPTINNPPADLTKATRIIFVPKDNFNTIKSFRAEVDGQWLRFTNDKGKTWIYNFDEKFTRGEHYLKVIVEDEAGNVMEKVWKVKR